MADLSWRRAGVAAAHPNGRILLGGAALQSNGVFFTGGYWLVTGSTTRFAIPESGPAPGAPTGVNFSAVGLPALNADGQFIFQAELQDPGFGGANRSGVWANRDGTLHALAHAGEASAEFGPGVSYSGFTRHNTAINDAGQVVYHAHVNGAGITESNNQAFILDDGGSRRLVARIGMAAPGTIAGLTFGRLDLGHVALNNAGQIAFSGLAAGLGIDVANAPGLWLEESPGQLRSIARSGDPAPGGGVFKIDRANRSCSTTLGRSRSGRFIQTIKAQQFGRLIVMARCS